MSRDRTIAATRILLAAAAGWSQAPLPDSPQTEQRIARKAGPGRFEVFVGDSSASTPLRQQFILEPK